MTDPRKDLLTVWAALDEYAETLFADSETEKARRTWDDICEAMARIAESFGINYVEDELEDMESDNA